MTGESDRTGGLRQGSDRTGGLRQEVAWVRLARLAAGAVLSSRSTQAGIRARETAQIGQFLRCRQLENQYMTTATREAMPSRLHVAVDQGGFATGTL